MKIPVSPLTSHIGFWMRRVSNHVSHSFSRRLNSSGVTVAEWVILREMYDSEEMISPSIVAELTALTRGAVSKLIERLLQKGLVSRTESKDDRRYQHIQLTPVAVKLIPKLAKLADENDQAFFNSLSALERKNLIDLLKKIAELNQLDKIPIN